MDLKKIGLVVGSLSAIASFIVFMEYRSHQAYMAEKAQEEQVEKAARAEEQRIQVEGAAITKRALTNLENWKSSFTSENVAMVCYHGHVFTPKQMLYEVTCDIGVKGFTPTQKVVCNQDRCTYSSRYDAAEDSEQHRSQDAQANR